MTGSLQKKGNTYYAVIRIADGEGKTKQKWVSTGIKATGNNKREANRRLQEILSEMEAAEKNTDSRATMLFVDWVKLWLEQKKKEVRLNSWETYSRYTKAYVMPYFEPLTLKVTEVTSQHVQDFYNLYIKAGLSGSSIHCIAKVVYGSLKEAYRNDLIPSNPAERAKKPSKKSSVGKAYTSKQAQKLLAVIKGRTLEPVVTLALFYGLRRSEVIGLRWRDVDFENNTILICNTIVQQETRIEQEMTKTRASRRTLHMPADARAYLLDLKKKQEKHRKRMGRAYHPGDYVCTHEDGRPFTPIYVTTRFNRVLLEEGLPVIRFHDLRHTAASMLIEQGVMLVQVSKFLGHERIATTVDIYGHLSDESKKETAEAMGNLLTISG